MSREIIEFIGDPPPEPFGGGAAARPIRYGRTDARAANDNAPPAANDNGSGLSIRQDIDDRIPAPRWLADAFTGQPLLDGKSRPITLGPVSYLALNTGISLLAAGLTAATITWAPLAAPVVIPWTMLVQTGRMRKMQTHLGHESGHGNFFLSGDPRRERKEPAFLGMNLNDLLGEVATTLALSHNMEAYRRDHSRHHDPKDYTTLTDPDTAYVLGLAQPIRALVDPLAYAKDFFRRLKSNLLATRPAKDGSGAEAAYWPRRLMGAVWVAALVATAFIIPLPAWFAAVFVPYVVLFRASAILQILSLHAWNLPPVGSFQEYADRTWGRFSGIPLPRRGLRGVAWLKAWSAWWAEILLLELPFRIGVLSSDLQAHDVHHLEWILHFDLGALPVFVDDWRNQPFRRAEVIRDSGDPLGMAKREIWGVRAMWKLAQDNLKRLRT